MEQPNSGVSAALNKGLDLASGDYITFLGNDDHVSPGMYAKMLNRLTETSSDVAVCDFNLVYEDGTSPKLKYSKTGNDEIVLQNDPYRYFAKCCLNPKSNNYIWSRLYASELIKKSGIRFHKLAIGEDTLFNFQLLAHVNKVVFLEEGFYNYFQRSTSVVRNVAKKKTLAVDYAEQFDHIADYYKSRGCDYLMEFLPLLAFTRMRSTFFYSRLSGMKDNEIIQSLTENFTGRQIGAYLSGKKVTED